jgi:hypothetical protein
VGSIAFMPPDPNSFRSCRSDIATVSSAIRPLQGSQGAAHMVSSSQPAFGGEGSVDPFCRLSANSSAEMMVHSATQDRTTSMRHNLTDVRQAGMSNGQPQECKPSALLKLMLVCSEHYSHVTTERELCEPEPLCTDRSN